MEKSQTPRSWATTIGAIVIGLVISVLILATIPLANWTEIAFFSIGVLLMVLCGAIAIEGKEGTLKDIISYLRFWS